MQGEVQEKEKEAHENNLKKIQVILNFKWSSPLNVMHPKIQVTSILKQQDLYCQVVFQMVLPFMEIDDKGEKLETNIERGVIDQR